MIWMLITSTNNQKVHMRLCQLCQIWDSGKTNSMICKGSWTRSLLKLRKWKRGMPGSTTSNRSSKISTSYSSSKMRLDVLTMLSSVATHTIASTSNLMVNFRNLMIHRLLNTSCKLRSKSKTNSLKNQIC